MKNFFDALSSKFSKFISSLDKVLYKAPPIQKDNISDDTKDPLTVIVNNFRSECSVSQPVLNSSQQYYSKDLTRQ